MSCLDVNLPLDWGVPSRPSATSAGLLQSVSDAHYGVCQVTIFDGMVLAEKEFTTDPE